MQTKFENFVNYGDISRKEYKDITGNYIIAKKIYLTKVDISNKIGYVKSQSLQNKEIFVVEYLGEGSYKSVNGGKSWKNMGLGRNDAELLIKFQIITTF